jgi:hypothetical protein
VKTVDARKNRLYRFGRRYAEHAAHQTTGWDFRLQAVMAAARVLENVHGVGIRRSEIQAIREGFGSIEDLRT